MKESKMGYNSNTEEIIPYNVEKIRKKGVKIIYNVYQSKYSNGKIWNFFKDISKKGDICFFDRF